MLVRKEDAFHDQDLLHLANLHQIKAQPRFQTPLTSANPFFKRSTAPIESRASSQSH